MTEGDIQTQLDAIEKKVDEIKKMIRLIKKIFIWTVVVSAAMIILPLIGIAFAIPSVISSYGSLLQ